MGGPLARRWGAPALAVVALVAVVTLTLGPDVIAGLGSGALDRTAHAGAYAGLAAAALLALPRSGRRGSGIGIALLVVIGVCAFGGIMEAMQGLEHRDADILDAAANAAGAFTVFALWLIGRGTGSIWYSRRAGGSPSDPGDSGVRADQALAG
ncbi:MAG: hypothetical protein QOE83_427 [Actinomycetota bacterium]|nr:hypothetical protein [Actinomycetota bacterium]